MPAVPGQWPGSFVVDLDGAMVGQILLRRAAEHRRPAAAGQLDLGYPFLPRAWGFGYAHEACTAALDWFGGVLPGEPVVLSTQTANARSMRLASGWDSRRWSGCGPGTPSSGSAGGPRARPATEAVPAMRLRDATELLLARESPGRGGSAIPGLLLRDVPAGC